MTKCDVIQDLIPLYYDDVASEGSRALIDEHIKDCDVCREMLSNMKDSSKIKSLDINNIDIKALRKIKRKIIKRIIIISSSVIFGTLILVWMMFTWGIPTPHNIENIVVHPVDTVVPYEGGVWNETPIIDIRNYYDRVALMQIGDELFVSSVHTFYTRFIRQEASTHLRFMGHPDNKSLTIMGLMPDNITQRIEVGEDIVRIYFMNANYNKLFSLSQDNTESEALQNELEKAKRNAVLLWER
jgi:hypothetical protein